MKYIISSTPWKVGKNPTQNKIWNEQEKQEKRRKKKSKK